MRHPEIAVLSDLHLGRSACLARALTTYLDGIRPRTLVLAGDVVDLWHCRLPQGTGLPDAVESPRVDRWSAAHDAVLRRILHFADSGVDVFYLTGNHDEALRPWSGNAFGAIRLVDRLELELDGVRTLFLHGDQVGDCSHPTGLRERCADMIYERVLLGANALVNGVAGRWLGRTCSPATWAKSLVPGVGRFVARYEQAVAEHAGRQGHETVVCGHIHHPALRRFITTGGPVTYLNSGDWVEHATALEYEHGAWSLMQEGRTLRKVVTARVQVEAGV
jgi:UDP-2,3-diacylglucosamine pyrophosphatase LpxH